MNKFLLSLLILFCFNTIGMLEAFADDVEEAKKSIVKIKGRENGTGFIIAKVLGNQKNYIYIVTARHVISGEDEDDKDYGDNQIEATIQFYKTGDPIKISAENREIFMSPNDIALLKVDANKYDVNIKNIDSVYLANTNELNSYLKLSSGKSFTYDAVADWSYKETVYSGVVDAYHSFGKGDIIRGNSGGPIMRQEKLNKRWIVWGLVNEITSGFARIVTAPTIRQFVRGKDKQIIECMETPSNCIKIIIKRHCDNCKLINLMNENDDRQLTPKEKTCLKTCPITRD